MTVRNGGSHVEPVAVPKKKRQHHRCGAVCLRYYYLTVHTVTVIPHSSPLQHFAITTCNSRTSVRTRNAWRNGGGGEGKMKSGYLHHQTPMRCVYWVTNSIHTRFEDSIVLLFGDVSCVCRCDCSNWEIQLHILEGPNHQTPCIYTYHALNIRDFKCRACDWRKGRRTQ